MFLGLSMQLSEFFFRIFCWFYHLYSLLVGCKIWVTFTASFLFRWLTDSILECIKERIIYRSSLFYFLKVVILVQVLMNGVVFVLGLVLGWELHSLSFDFLGWTRGWFRVSMEASSAECGCDSRNRVCWRFVCVYSHRAHIQESRILCKCWYNCWTGEFGRKSLLLFPLIATFLTCTSHSYVEIIV